MDDVSKVLYSRDWPWGMKRGVRIDEELFDDYPAMVLRGKGICLVSLAPELEEALQETAVWLEKSGCVDGKALDDFLFAGEAPTVPDIAYWLKPGKNGICPVNVPGVSVRFGLSSEDLSPMIQAVSEADWQRGGIAPMARALGVYDGERLVAVAGGRLQGDVLDMTVLTLPEARGRGLAGHALSQLIAEYPEAIPLWRAEAGNTESLHLAERMGFETFLTQEGIMLLDEDEE